MRNFEIKSSGNGVRIFKNGTPLTGGHHEIELSENGNSLIGSVGAMREIVATKEDNGKWKFFADNGFDRIEKERRKRMDDLLDAINT